MLYFYIFIISFFYNITIILLYKDEKKQEKQKLKKEIITEEEWAIVLPNVEPHNIRNIKEILQKNNINRIEESTSL